MSFKDRWFAEYERHMDEKMSMGVDWEEASAFAAMQAEQDVVNADAERADMLNDWEPDEAALVGLDDA